MRRVRFSSWFSRFKRVIIIVVALLAVIPVTEGQTRKGKAKAKTTQTTKKSNGKKTQARSMESVKREQTTTQRQISETASKIKNNEKRLNSQLNKLNSLNADIESNQKVVSTLRTTVDSLGTQITVTTDSIKILENNLEDMQRAYVKALKQMQPHAGEMSVVTFIFSSKSFSEAYRRIRYLQQFSDWRKRKTGEIETAIEDVDAHRLQLTALKQNHDNAYRKAEAANKLLEKQQSESKQLVASLRNEDAALRKSLNEQKRKAAALDRELDRLIAAEQARIAREEAERKKKEAAANKKQNAGKSAGSTTAAGESPSAKEIASANAKTQTAAATAEAALSGSFADNKGRLLFPVAGNYKIVRKFGRQPHPTLKHVETDNSGIDIEVGKGSQARAIFTGKVSAIFRQDGFNTIVMIRHGKYISIYAGLSGVNVKQGDTVKTGQTLGSIYSDPDDSNRTILHFEIRNERQKLNPTLWVK